MLTHVKNGGKLYCQGHSKLIAVDAAFTSELTASGSESNTEIVPTERIVSEWKQLNNK